MVATILSEVSVGLTPEIEAALENAVAFAGIKSSQYVRIALVEKLVPGEFPKTSRSRAARKINAEKPPANRN